MEVREPPGPTVDVQTNRLATFVGRDRASHRENERRAVGRRELWCLAAALLALTVFLRLPAFFVDVFNSDETFLATQAEVIRKAVKGMLPKNRLAAAQLTKLKVYAGPEHPHAAQAPKELKVSVTG